MMTITQDWCKRADGEWLEAPVGEIRSIARGMLERGARFAALVGKQTETGDLRFSWHWDLKGTLLSARSTVALKTVLPSIVDIYPGADWAEREARDYFAVSFEGRESTLPLMLREDDPPGLLLRAEGERP
jgi:hypothetical protein